jgi:lipid-A-disaccharide synthase
MVAGEASGDLLGAGLITALRRRVPDLQVEGVAGPHMQAAGCEVLCPVEKLAVMGLVEVLSRYRELHALRRRLIRRFLDDPPDIFVGVDAPDFNLELERALHRAGIRTVHYVSPTVWAWRRYRLQRMARSVDLVLTLYPFEEALYREARVPAVCVGHPLADRIPEQPDRGAARARLGLESGRPLVALLPGSRVTEVARLARVFLEAAAWIAGRRPNVSFAASFISDETETAFRHSLAQAGLAALPLHVFRNRSHDVLEASDVALLASGTAALEAMLFRRPMVVAYRMHWLTFRVLKALVRVRYAAMPNLLAGRPVVPELLQDDCTPPRLGAEVLRWLDDAAAVEDLSRTFGGIHAQLRRGASDRAAEALLRLSGAA